MEQGIVSNQSEEQVVVQFGGLNYYFDAGQQSMFPLSVAESIAREDSRLSVVSQELPKAKAPKVKKADVAPEPEEAPIEEPMSDGQTDLELPDVYEAKENSTGRMQYRKNGILISKEDYDNRPQA